ncbi:engulfment and cell motility protein 1 [Zootermopsis nevadensis]|uniref:Engulfment and cell motility protein 1 n=1 Tax=Zootermopsis nevadensis TaxID=136037 RepID=A0A067QYM9_ZOONE|nr:engulfment and cell motility protein 1 [Zootermopsis nevadensis]KDR14604.1 Engulfment and cell motility protein 1 [Zootermopsis nevadensis]
MNTKVFKMPAMKDSNIVKIAVEMAQQVPQLIEFNQKQPLAAIIQELCNGWGLSDPDQYALQFSENNNQNYITEKNRNEIKNGSVLRLTHSPSTTAHDILQKLNTGTNEDKLNAVQKLSKLSTDMTFALEFINKQGLALIISIIEGGKCKGNMLAYSLISFVELMDHGIVSWDILESPFINKVASYVNNQAVAQDAKVVQASLSILENIVLNSSGKYGQVEREVTFPNLVMHLQSQNPVIQQNAIALINALFLKADNSKRKAISATLSSKQVRNVILTNVIQSSSGQVGAEMAHQLYVLQTLTLGLLEQRMSSKMDPQDQDAHEKIKELRRIAFDTDGTGVCGDVTARKQLGVFAKDYKKLGFKYDINPALDFTETPPGMLALDCMVYFARHHTENYTKVVLENSCRADEHECPFGRTSVELVKLLCEVLRIGEAPSEQGQNYHPMFFTHDHPFEEFFCICIILLNKTWKEMRATIEDFVKVFSVVREQITRALASQPTGLDKFRAKLQVLTYSEITNLWQQERTSREEWESHARPIVELKEQIKPEIMELIQQQRLGFLVEGTRFTKYSMRGQRIKDKFWYVRLSPNHKVFHYGDCDEKSVPTLEELPNKLAVVDIKALITGKECPHMKDIRGRKTTHQLAFSLTLDSVEVTSLDFVAPDEQVFDYWTDGINALLGNKMLSKETENDVETLLSMDIKLRLLDAEGVDIPEDPPPIPSDPPNYDFCYELK